MASVLLIEIEAPLVRLMGWFLTEAGYEVTTAADADRAVDEARAAGPPIIVLNTALPDPDKAQCVERLRSLVPAARILDVSANSWPRQPADTGADRYLQIPFHADSFIEAVSELARA